MMQTNTNTQTLIKNEIAALHNIQQNIGAELTNWMRCMYSDERCYCIDYPADKNLLAVSLNLYDWQRGSCFVEGFDDDAYFRDALCLSVTPVKKHTFKKTWSAVRALLSGRTVVLGGYCINAAEHLAEAQKTQYGFEPFEINLGAEVLQ